MTQEEKLLLLKDLCARLPYGVEVEIDGFYRGILKGIDGDIVSTDRGINYPLRLVKPYLRQMSSMTDKEREEYNVIYACRCHEDSVRKFQELCYSKHFDCNDLIGHNLALEAPVGMYKL